MRGPTFLKFYTISLIWANDDILALSYHSSTCLFQAGDALSRTLDDEWIADNAEKVTRILPGGINIVGASFL